MANLSFAFISNRSRKTDRRSIQSNFNRWLICLAILAAGFLIKPTNGFCQDDAILSIAQTATAAQQSGDFKFAAQTWEKLVKQFPNSKLIGKAQFNAGVCYTRAFNFPKAIESLAAAIPKLEDNPLQKSEARFFLGFCHFRQGQNAAAQNDEAANQLASSKFSTAATTLGQLIADDPKFVDLDQVCFYQGEALTELGKPKEALVAYLKMIKCPKQTLRLEGLYAIGDTYEQLGEFKNAVEYYDQFLASVNAAGGHPLENTIRWRLGASLMELADLDSQANKPQAANEKFERATNLFRKILNQDPASRTDDWLEVADNARLDLASCHRKMGKFSEAAELYEEIAKDPNSAYSGQSLANAGRNYLDAKQFEKAIATLESTISTQPKYANLAAHWLATHYLVTTKEPQKAYDLVVKQMQAAGEVSVALMLDQAEAAYALPGKLKESAELFETVFRNNPQHRLAPLAFKNAVFARLDSNDYDATLKLADEFASTFSQSEHLPVVMGLKGEALLLGNRPREAIAALNAASERFPDHENVNFWKLRAGIAHYMQDEYQETVELIQSIVGNFAEPDRKAESWFWVGSSQFQLQRFPESVTSFESSVSADQNWSRADETLLMLTRAQLAANQAEMAKQTAITLATRFPKSAKRADLAFYLGDHFFKQKNWTDALTRFKEVIENHSGTRFEPLAIYQAALCYDRTGKPKDSELLLTDLITRFPDHELAKEAKIDRGSMRLKSGDAESSIADLRAFLLTNPDPDARNEAEYKIGLAQIELKRYDEAIKTLNELVVRAATSRRLDFYLYDLAWAYKYRKLETPDAEDLSLKYFEQITATLPTSDMAGEANFHLGTAAYDSGDYPKAAQAFGAAFKSETAENVREKAAYKLGWSYYKQKKYTEAANSFREQLQAFEKGGLAADGAFMIAESYFRDKKFAEALTSYKTAQPIIDAATEIQPNIRVLNRLHGSQAAIKVKRYQDAANLAQELTEISDDKTVQQDAWLEYGYAQQGLGRTEAAIEAWKKAAQNLGKTGARASCMIGDHYFKQKKFEDAINQFKTVFFGFGGPQATDEVKPWQAYAVYEAARCNYVQIRDAPAALKERLKAEAIRLFQYLLDNYPNDALAKEARRQLANLKG